MATNLDVTNVKRIGIKSVDKIRPIKVVMDTRLDVIKVVSNWKNLPKHIKVSFDHTINQRLEYKKLKDQAEVFNKNQTGNCIKIIKFKHGNPTLFTVDKKNKTTINKVRVNSLDKVKNA